MLLAFDCSTMTTSAALVDGSRVLGERDAPASQRSEILLPLVDEILAAAGVTPQDLSAIACGIGPGSYTGLRIGLATAKGLCFALSRPLVAISSQAALAVEGHEAARARNGLVLAVTDARRDEVYGGLYDPAAPLDSLIEVAVYSPAALVEKVRAVAGGRPLVLVGDGLALARETFAGLGQAMMPELRLTPRAVAVAALAAARLAREPGTDDLGSATPAYLRLVPAEEKFPAG
jgi:tRNA threonylcarbamoyladenosine biosynthesis protein TsaB